MDSTPDSVVSITLQPGRWVLQAKAVIGTIHAIATGSCTMLNDETLFNVQGAFDIDPMVLLDVAEFATETTLHVVCRTNSSEVTAQLIDPVIVATMVGTGA